MKKNENFEKFYEYYCRMEKSKNEIMRNSDLDWEKMYEEEDSYEEVVFNF